jgi:hypothetical protein
MFVECNISLKTIFNFLLFKTEIMKTYLKYLVSFSTILLFYQLVSLSVVSGQLTSLEDQQSNHLSSVKNSHLSLYDQSSKVDKSEIWSSMGEYWSIPLNNAIMLNPNPSGSFCLKKFALSFHGGKDIPIPPMKTYYIGNKGFMFDFEYLLAPRWALVLNLGRYEFDNNPPYTIDLVVSHMSLNAKYYTWQTPLCKTYSFINAGPGYYFPSAGHNKFGGNLGVGIGKWIKWTLYIEAALDIHRLFYSRYYFGFFHGGLIWRL